MAIYFLKSLPFGDAFITNGGRPVPFFGIPFETMEGWVGAALTPIVFILVGTWIAPARKWTTAVVLGVLWAMTLAIGMTLVLSLSKSLALAGYEFTFSTFLGLCLNAAGIFYALRTAFLEHGPKPSEPIDPASPP
jgi:hypothetical protein